MQGLAEIVGPFACAIEHQEDRACLRVSEKGVGKRRLHCPHADKLAAEVGRSLRLHLLLHDLNCSRVVISLSRAGCAYRDSYVAREISRRVIGSRFRLAERYAKQVLVACDLRLNARLRAL